MLEMINVSYAYKSKKEIVHVLDKVTYRFEIGEMYGIFGPSGSGKTTCLSLLAGLEKPDEGEILLDGENIQDIGGYRFVFDTDNSLELECGHNGKKSNHYGKNRCKSDGEHSHGKQRGNNAYDDSCKHKEPPKFWFRHLGFRLSAKNPYPLYYTPPNLRLRCS